MTTPSMYLRSADGKSQFVFLSDRLHVCKRSMPVWLLCTMVEKHVVEDQQFCIAAHISQTTHHLIERSSSSETMVHADTGGA